jgi:hypothetical protein
MERHWRASITWIALPVEKPIGALVPRLGQGWPQACTRDGPHQGIVEGVEDRKGKKLRWGLCGIEPGRGQGDRQGVPQFPSGEGEMLRRVGGGERPAWVWRPGDGQAQASRVSF